MILTAKILSTKKHPDASKLKVCTVDTGSEKFEVVCGASNVEINMVTILAQVGSILPSQTKIEIGELRGVKSYGMLCSAKDLNISNESGIIHLDDNQELGVLYTELDKSLLSSIPWFTYKLVDTHVEKKNGIIQVVNAPIKIPEGTVISQSYWDGSKYLYRSF